MTGTPHKQLLSLVGTAFSLVMLLAGLFTFREDYASVGIGMMGAGVLLLLAIVFLALRSYRRAAEAAQAELASSREASQPDHKLELGRANLRRVLEDLPAIEKANRAIEDAYDWYQIVEHVVAQVCGRASLDDLRLAWKGKLGEASYSRTGDQPSRKFIWKQEQVRPFFELCMSWLDNRASELNAENINPLFYHDRSPS